MLEVGGSSPAAAPAGSASAPPAERRFDRALTTAKHALNELGNLSGGEFCDGLLVLSSDCVSTMHTNIAAVRDHSSAVVVSMREVPEGERMVQVRRGIEGMGMGLWAPLAAALVYGFLALMNTVLAMSVRCAMHTPAMLKEVKAMADRVGITAQTTRVVEVVRETAGPVVREHYERARDLAGREHRHRHRRRARHRGGRGREARDGRGAGGARRRVG